MSSGRCWRRCLRSRRAGGGHRWTCAGRSRGSRGGSEPVRRGVTSRSGSDTGTRSISGSPTGRPTAPGPGYWAPFRARRPRRGGWSGRGRWTPRSPGCTSTAPPWLGTQGAGSSYTNPCHRLGDLEPPDHAIGRSRGGVTCKIHLATDGKGRPLGLVLTGGNAADTSFFTTVLDTISVRDGRPGRPRTRPERGLADKAYTSAANRRYLTGRGIRVAIPERDDQKAGRARRGSAGGRPRSFDAEAYKGRNVVERCFNKLKQWRAIATRFDKTARSYLAGLTLAATLIWTR